MLDLRPEARFAGVHSSHQRVVVPVSDRASERGRGARRGGRFQPPEHGGCGDEPLSTHFPARYIATLEESVDRVGRDGEQLGRPMDIQDLKESPSGARRQACAWSRERWQSLLSVRASSALFAA